MKVKLKDIIIEVNERTTKNNQYPILTSSQNGIFLQEEYFKKNVASKNNIGYKIIRKGEFTYRSMSDTGNFTINRLENIDIGIVSPAYPVFKCNGVNPDYLKYYFSSNNFKRQIDNLYQGGTRVALKLKDLENIEIEIPTEDEQTKIVKLLKNLDNLISRYEEAAKEKEQFIKSQFVEMFGNEKNKIKLKDACYIKGRIGWQRLNRKEYLKKGDYYLVTGVDIMNNHRIDFNKCFYVSKERYEKDSKIQLKSGDIILTKDGTIGKVAMIYELDKPATLNSHLFVIRDISGNFDNIYFLNLFLSDIFMNFANKKTNGSTRKGLSQASIENFDIPLPAMTKQMEFRKIYELIDKQKFELEKQKKNYELLKKGIMQRLIDAQQ